MFAGEDWPLYTDHTHSYYKKIVVSLLNPLMTVCFIDPEMKETS